MAVDLGGLLGGAVAGYGLYDQYKELADAGQDYQAAVQPIIQQAGENLQFRPYTVTSSLGGTSVSPEGQLSYTPSQQMQAIQDQTFGGAQQLFGQALAPTGQRVQDLYGQMRALQTPEEQRQRLLNEERMAAQGRLGLQSAAYGGTSPELLAQEQAIAQARNQASLMAQQQAQAEQAQAYNIGAGLLSSGFAPQAQLMDQQTQAYQLAQLAQNPQLEYARTIANLGLGGVEAAQAAEANRQNLLGQMYSLGAGMLGGTQNSVTGEMQQGLLGSAVNSIGSSIGGFFGDLFGGGSPTVTIDSVLADPSLTGGTTYYPPASSFMPSNLGNTSGVGTFNYNPTGTGLF